MNNIKYHIQIGVTEHFTKIMTESTKGIGQREMKWSTKDFFLFESWLYSKKYAEAAMDVGTDMVGMVKTKKIVFLKETIENLKKY